MKSREYKYHQRKKEERKWRELDWDIPIKVRNPNDTICEEEDCSHFATVKCVLDYHDETGKWEEEVEWLCCDHARENGYCMGCGTFISGTGMEFYNNGYCDNCYDEIRSAEMDDDEDFPDGSLDY